MNAITPLHFDFGSTDLRAFERDGAIWFAAEDVARALDYDRTRNMIRMLDDDEKGAHIVSTLGGNQEVTFLNESGLYHAVLKSRKPEARAFRRWVTSEVLPSIRRHGHYTARPEKTREELPGGLTVEQQDAIKSVVRSRVEALPRERQAKGAITIWSSIKSKFGVSYKELPADYFGDALSLAARVPLEGELLEGGGRYDLPARDYKPANALPNGQAWMTFQNLMGASAPDPVNDLLRRMEEDGHDVSGPRQYHRAQRHLMERWATIMNIASRELESAMNVGLGVS